MTFDRDFIVKILGDVHPDNLISKESSECLIELFGKYDNMTREQIVEETTGQLKEHSLKYETKDELVEYILAEILELAGICASDSHKRTITKFHVWLAINNDAELSTLFTHPTLPLKYHNDYKKRMALPIKTVKDKMASSMIICSTDFDILSRFLLSRCFEYSDEQACAHKITSLGFSPNHTKQLLQLQEIVLNEIVKRLQNYVQEFPGKITFSVLENVIIQLVQENGNYTFLIATN